MFADKVVIWTVNERKSSTWLESVSVHCSLPRLNHRPVLYTVEESTIDSLVGGHHNPPPFQPDSAWSLSFYYYYYYYTQYFIPWEKNRRKSATTTLTKLYVGITLQILSFFFRITTRILCVNQSIHYSKIMKKIGYIWW